MRSTLWILALVLLCAAWLIVGCSAPKDDGAAVAAGQTAWSGLTCSNCHGGNGEGGGAPALAGTALSEQAFVDIVRNGQGRMPAFDAAKISDDDLAAVYAWLKSLAE